MNYRDSVQKIQLVVIFTVVCALIGSTAYAGLVAHYDFAFQHTPYTSWHYEDISGNGHHGDEVGSWYKVNGSADNFADMWEYAGGTRGGVYSYTWNNEVDYDSSGGVDNGVLGTGAWKNNRLDINAIAPIPDLAANAGLTFALWVNPQDVFFDGKQRPHFEQLSTSSHLVGLGEYGNAPIMSIQLDDTRHIHGWVEGNGTDTQYGITGTGTIPANEWTHIAITYDRANNEAKTYINGELDSTTAIPGVGDGVLTWKYAKIGGSLRNTDTETFIGQIDDVRIYDEVLSESQIGALLAQPSAPALIVHYDFAFKHTPYTSWHCEDITGHGYHGKELGSYYKVHNIEDAYADMWEDAGGEHGGVYSYTWNNEVDYDSSGGTSNGVLGTNDWDNNRVDINGITPISALAANAGLTFALWVNPQDVFFDGLQRPHFGAKSNPNARFAHLVGMGNYGDAPIMSIELDTTRHVHGWIEGNGVDTQYEITGMDTIPANKWTHIAITYDRVNNEAKTYINGKLDSTTAIPGVGDGVLTWTYAKIGGSLISTTYKDAFVGQMDDVRIYYDVLSESQIAGLLPPPKGTVILVF